MAVTIDVRRYQDGDGEHVAEHIRDADRKEIFGLSLCSPLPAIRVTLALSVGAWTGTVDGEVSMIFGIARKAVLSDIGVPWMLGTPLVEKVPMSFLRRNREYVERFDRAFPVQENWVLAENHRAVAWLKWLGFAMDEPSPMGPLGLPFIRFTKGM